MEVFSIVEDAHVILYARGIYRQAKVFKRGDRHYAAQGSGFVRLLKGGQTTVPATRWIDGDGFAV